jgi:DNA-directed RNA polymerase specialized sigma24 family protein
LNTVLLKGELPSGKYCPDDFMGQLFIEAFDHFNKVEHKEDLYTWLFKKADNLLEDTLVDEEFDEYFFENIDNFSRPEWDTMLENFSADVDGDLVMLEELDDISYRKNDYILNHIFVEDDKKTLIAKLDQKMGDEAVKKQHDMVLNHLPLPKRTVFELATEYHFNLDEIAEIRDQSLQEVQQILENARKSLEISYLNMHFVEEQNSCALLAIPGNSYQICTEIFIKIEPDYPVDKYSVYFASLNPPPLLLWLRSAQV